MRCDRMNATIPTAFCLKRQTQVEGYVKERKRSSNNDVFLVPNIPAHACYKCPKGAEVKKSKEVFDMDIETLKTDSIKAPEQAERTVVTMRTCSRCGTKKELRSFWGKNEKCRKCSIADSRARMKEANSKEQEPCRETFFDQTKETIPVPTERILSIEIAGHRINLCPECARRYLKI